MAAFLPGAGPLVTLHPMKLGVFKIRFFVMALLFVFPLVAQARRFDLKPVTIEADHVMGKTEKPKPKPQIDPEVLAQAESLLDEALSMLSLGRYENARTLLAQAKKIHPDHSGVLRASARTLLTLGYLKWNEDMALEAQDDLTRARKLRPKDMALVELERLVQNLVGRIQRLKRPRPRPSPQTAAP